MRGERRRRRESRGVNKRLYMWENFPPTDTKDEGKRIGKS